jgi:hypothetical protein
VKIATGIISLVLMLVVGVQSCGVALGGSVFHDQSGQTGGSLGFLVAFLFLLGGAFAFAKPFVSMIFFALAAIFGWTGGSTTTFSDLTVWGFVSLILGIMSFFGWRGDRKKRNQQNNSAQA